LNKNVIALPYADALIKSAIDLNCQDQIKYDFLLISDVFDKHSDLLEQLSSPSLTSDEKLQCILNAFSVHVCKLFQDFFRVLIYRNRLNVILEISEFYNQLYNQYNNITNIKIICAFPLDNKLADYIYEKMKSFLGVNINIQYESDPGLLAGLKIIYDDKLIDFSASSKLRRFRQQLSDQISISIKSRSFEKPLH
jgi:F-type H+-transporting ATPase subunit delta